MEEVVIGEPEREDVVGFSTREFKSGSLIDEDESLRDEGEDDNRDATNVWEHNFNLDHSECKAPDMRDNIIFEAAVDASTEVSFIADLGAKCRTELFELILKADLDKEKIKEKVRSLQEFLVASEHRTDALVSRIERLLKIGECKCTK
jgi:hypothetical protein